MAAGNRVEATTAESNYFRVNSWQGKGNRRAEKDLVLGLATSDSGRLKYTVPDAPPADVYYVEPWNGEDCDPRKLKYYDKPFDGCIRMEIGNVRKSRREQVWERDKVPESWLPHNIDRVAREKYSIKRGRNSKAEPDMDWFRDEEKLSDEMYTYATREWHRRIYGMWLMINERLTYITGAHYYYLAHFKLDNGYPKYRDRDRRWFYAWQVCLEDPMCVGMIYLKHRRDGATYRCASIGLETATRGHVEQANFGITSKSDEDAEEAFRTKVIEPWKNLVPFFNPITGAATDVKKKLEFKPASRSGIDRYAGNNTGLGSQISYRAKSEKGKSGYDNLKLHIALCDEGGKRTRENILEAHRLMLPTMNLDGIWGKMLYPSTNEEIEGDNAENWQTMWDDSDPSMCETSSQGTTISQLYRYFTPAYDGPDEEWFGPFGESIVGAPTKEQIEYLTSLKGGIYAKKFGRFWERNWGAYEWLVDYRNNQKDIAGTMRQYPFTPEESFIKTNVESDYNLDNVNRTINSLKTVTASGQLLVNELTIRGNLEWYDDVFKAKVKFVPHPEGRFLFNRDYMPGSELAEDLRITNEGIVKTPPRQGLEHAETYGSCRPGSDTWIVIGTDPQKTAKIDMKKNRRYSSAAAHGFYPYRYEMEKEEWVAQCEEDPDFARDWVTHAFIFEYMCIPKDPAQHHEDMLKACFFLNAKLLFERQLPDINGFFTKHGCRSFLITDEQWILKLGTPNRAKEKERAKQNAAPGLPSSDAVIDLYKGRTKAYIDYFCWPNKCPFLLTLGQWVDFKRDNIEKLDLQVSSGFSLLAANPGWQSIKKEPKKVDIAPDATKMKQGIRGYTRLYR